MYIREYLLNKISLYIILKYYFFVIQIYSNLVIIINYYEYILIYSKEVEERTVWW